MGRGNETGNSYENEDDSPDHAAPIKAPPPDGLPLPTPPPPKAPPQELRVTPAAGAAKEGNRQTPKPRWAGSWRRAATRSARRAPQTARDAPRGPRGGLRADAPAEAGNAGKGWVWWGEAGSVTEASPERWGGPGQSAPMSQCTSFHPVFRPRQARTGPSAPSVQTLFAAKDPLAHETAAP